MAHRLGDARVDLDLGVVVGVQVDEPRCDPASLRVDDRRAQGTSMLVAMRVTMPSSTSTSTRRPSAPVPSNTRPSRINVVDMPQA